MSPPKPRVIVGLSGGVDSSVAALLLLEQGYRVEGLFMKNWDEDDADGVCAAAEDLDDALAVCAALDIPLHKVSFAREYWDRVFRHFLDEYRAGRTPNPDVLCNTEIKFRAFLDHALDLGADAIATGHYARVRRADTGFELLKGQDADKDQSYFLHGLGQRALSRTLFPVGGLTKAEVREHARRAGLPTHAKKDSTGICFIGERRFREFLGRYLPAQPGAIESVHGGRVGTHQGLMYYTLGQRQGLGIGGVAGYPEAPWYVADKDLARNVLIVTQNPDDARLMRSALRSGPGHWVAGTAPALPLECRAKIRYRQADQACTIQPLPDAGLHVHFAQAQRAITPGQSVVFYDGERCLGGAIIETVD